ncbi:60S ribosomal protein L6 [Trichinella britovi]|uniref:Large ribosomal subunit protein eL6 n=1 Tax=Trichinella britovi TaxID=45882 RepID=A0A0V1DGS5_TRIBR|nr:60S ribosomal protein L6 [Trichinella sp. T6]KRY60564.1 60S ribosomal protein L6 [Trichinella britovi]
MVQEGNEKSGHEKVEGQKKTGGQPFSKNQPIGRVHVMRFSRARMFAKRCVYKYLKPKKIVPKLRDPVSIYKIKPVGGENNGKERKVLVKKPPKLVSVVKRRKKPKLSKNKFFKNHPKKLKPSLTPGTIVILLAGRHKGKRAVFLKQLGSGLLLITGPHKLNGCPLRRINQIYVIGTKTKLNIKDVEIPDHLNDSYFKRIKQKKRINPEADIFVTKKKKYVVSEQRKKDQKAVDSMVLNAIRSSEDKKYLFGYLGSNFGLRKGDCPHKMVF